MRVGAARGLLSSGLSAINRPTAKLVGGSQTVAGRGVDTYDQAGGDDPTDS